MVNNSDRFVYACIIHVNNIGSSSVFHHDSLRQVNFLTPDTLWNLLLRVLLISRNARSRGRFRVACRGCMSGQTNEVTD